MGREKGGRRAALTATVATGALLYGTAAAQTDAGSVIENTFTLDYSVGGVAQTGITNESGNPGGRTTQGAPTEFTVDRTVNLTVTSAGVSNAASGQSGVALFYSIKNDGNDAFRYILTLAENSTNNATVNTGDASRDNFDTTGSVAYNWYVSATTCSASVGDYSGSGAVVASDVAPGSRACILTRRDVPAGRSVNEQAGVYLTAQAAYPSAWVQEAAVNKPDGTAATTGAAVDASTGNNVIGGVAQNVFLDPQGAHTTADAAGDGRHSGEGFVLVANAGLQALKYVYAQATEAASCAAPATPTAPNASTGLVENDQFLVPGACAVYVITIENDSPDAASSIAISDSLPTGVSFSAVGLAGSLTGTTATSSCGPSDAGPCVVTLSGGGLAAGATGGLVISAVVD